MDYIKTFNYLKQVLGAGKLRHDQVYDELLIIASILYRIGLLKKIFRVLTTKSVLVNRHEWLFSKLFDFCFNLEYLEKLMGL